MNLDCLIEPDCNSQWIFYNESLVLTPKMDRGVTYSDNEFKISKTPKMNESLYIVHIYDLDTKVNNATPTQEREISLTVQVNTEEELTIIECHFVQGGSNIGNFNKKVTSTYFVNSNAKLRHHLLIDSSFATSNLKSSLHFKTEIIQEKMSQYRGFFNHFGNGSSGLWADFHLNLKGEAATAEFHTLQFPKQNEEQTLTFAIQHQNPHCQSVVIARGVVDDAAKFNFSGKIIVEKAAFGTEARLENKNILLTRKASVQTKPELEINHDDVRCSHGATVGHLDENALFYLRSRGIPEAYAKWMLIDGFIQPLIQHILHPPIRLYVEQALRSAEVGVNI